MVNEIDLFSEVKNNNRAAFEQLFRYYYKPLVRFALNIVKNTDYAEDLVQEVFVKIWEKRHQINLTAGIKPYLYMAVKNHCFNVIKSEQRNAYLSDDFSDDIRHATHQTQQQTDAIGLKSHIENAISLLPPRCALIFKMSRFEDKTYQEIADALDLSVKTIENQMGKALLMLRKQLSPYLHILIVMIKINLFLS